MKRRFFISAATLTSLGVFVSKFVNAKTNPPEKKLGIFPDKTTKPIVISTWNHGIAANKAAWEILEKKEKSEVNKEIQDIKDTLDFLNKISKYNNYQDFGQ